MSSMKKALPRPKQTSCEICLKNFTLLLKQHQCKRCLRAVCFDCGKHKSLIVNYDLKVQHRVCIICKEEQNYISEIIQKEQLSFNKNSLITKQWLRHYSQNLKEQQIIDEYYIILQESKKNLPQSTSEFLKQIPYMVSQVKVIFFDLQIRSSYHYSMAEFDYYMTKDMPDTTAAIYVSTILQCILFQHPTLKLTQKLVQIVLFLLYLHSQPLVFFFTNCLREEVSLGRFFESDQSFQSLDIDFLQEIGKKNYLIEPTDLLFYRKYLEKHAFEMLSTLFIKYLNIPCLLFLFDHIFKFKDIFELEKVAALLGQQHLSDFKQKGLDDDFFINQIIKNTKLHTLKEYLSKEDRIRMNSKREIHSKSDDSFYQQFQVKMDQQNEIKQILQLLDDCVLKSQPLNNFHRQIMSKLNFKQQQILSDLIGIKGHKLSSVKEQEDNFFDVKMETTSDSSTQFKLERSELVDQNRMLMEEITSLKEQLKQFKQDRQKEQEAIESLLNRQESIQIRIEKTVEKQINYIEQEPQCESNKCLIENTFERKIEKFEQQTQTYYDYESIIEGLKQELNQQKQFYEQKLQASASKQQQTIAKLLSDLSGSRMESSQSTLKEEILMRKKSESVLVAKSNNSLTNLELLQQQVDVQLGNQQQFLIKQQKDQQSKSLMDEQLEKHKQHDKDCIIQ